MKRVLVVPWSMAPTKSAMTVVLSETDIRICPLAVTMKAQLLSQKVSVSQVTAPPVCCSLLPCSPGGLAARNARDLGDVSPHLAEFVGEVPAAFAEVWVVGLDELAVSGQLQRRGEHLGRDGLLAGQLALQRPLPADAQAPGEELLLVELLGGVGRGQLLGDHRVGVEERAQYQVRHVRPGASQPPLRVGGAHLGAHLADVRVDQRQLRLQLNGELPPPGEEEVELQQLTQSQCLVPCVAPGPVPRDGHQPELSDRPY